MFDINSFAGTNDVLGFRDFILPAVDSRDPEPTVARYPIELVLRDPDEDVLIRAAQAVHQEHRQSTVWKRLRCQAVTKSADRLDGKIYELGLGTEGDGPAVEFDWTWEGATASSSQVTNEADDAPEMTESLPSEAAQRDEATWRGEVVEVDETTGHIFVYVEGKGASPRPGDFFVHPFDFLECLNQIYGTEDQHGLQARLPGRLHACRGNVHPRVNSPVSAGLLDLRSLWEHSWGVLWGPPGTGKTYTVGQQVAACLRDPTERILVVSTTNKATDEAALAIGRAAREQDARQVGGDAVVRLGKGAGFERFRKEGLLDQLKNSETDLLQQIAELRQDLNRTRLPRERAVIQQEIKSRLRQMKDTAYRQFVSPAVRVVVTTSFKAMTLLTNSKIASAISEGDAPFTTVIVDEAGLISRAATAALSLLAARRVVLVGDSKQLAPISRISRILPTNQKKWLAQSGLSHLQGLARSEPAICLLREQHRMHPDVCAAVSAYQYENQLRNAKDVVERSSSVPPLLAGQPRAIWYVLDEDADDLPSLRAERGPGNRSWRRPKAARRVLDRLLADESLQNVQGMFVSPFVAQATDIKGYFAEKQLASCWSAATIHSQQGTECDVVVFDTVNASNTSWPIDEWKRLVNVGISRAKECVILLASRAEMRQPYLSPLLPLLAPRILKWSGRSYKWAEVPAEVSYQPAKPLDGNPDRLGSEIRQRKQLRPVLSHEQERLCGLRLDGKPRLVRGVAGSGKTIVLGNWVVKTVMQSERPNQTIWVVYGNSSLHQLIRETIESSWLSERRAGPFPWDRVELHHIRDLLKLLLPEAGLTLGKDDYDYDRAASEFLARQTPTPLTARCDAMFIDEAQDMGPNTLRLLSALVAQDSPDDPNSRSLNIFYDNAQNVYGRKRPKWPDLGLDLRGRSTVMEESFRSTKPLSEFALNVLYRLQPPEADQDHRELVARGLIEKSSRQGEPWWVVHFNQVDGPNPRLRCFRTRDEEFSFLGDSLIACIRREGVAPGDICILYNNGRKILEPLKRHLQPRLADVGARLNVETSQTFTRDPNAVTVTTSQSFKGFDSEIVIVAGVDQFVSATEGILGNSLYVAMTRARSVLAIYGTRAVGSHSARLISVLETCGERLQARPEP